MRSVGCFSVTSGLTVPLMVNWAFVNSPTLPVPIEQKYTWDPGVRRRMRFLFSVCQPFVNAKSCLQAAMGLAEGDGLGETDGDGLGLGEGEGDGDGEGATQY